MVVAGLVTSENDVESRYLFKDSKYIYQSVNHYYGLNLQLTHVSYDYKIMFVNLMHLMK